MSRLMLGDWRRRWLGNQAAVVVMSSMVSFALAIAIAIAIAIAVAVAVAVRRLALAKAIEDPEGGPHGCGPFFIGTGMSRMKKPCVCIARAGW
ncbi:hypothetical protein [Lysobacter antibioticus]|uniref:hypothetical protein n=1 Tax=Lysobacter antibioticus TaxID=84531 RepID=UPI00165191ED|nr:hypothetical protein [Lysobacter antibioticus]